MSGFQGPISDEPLHPVFLIVGIKPQADGTPDGRHIRRAVQALRKERFVANTASAEAIEEQAMWIQAMRKAER